MKLHFTINKKVGIILASVSCLVLVGVATYIVIQHDADAERARVAAFETEKAQKLAGIIQENKKVQEDAAKKENDEHQKIQKLIDAGSLTTASVSNNCARLKNRDTVTLLGQSPCIYRMRATGTAKMAVVFVSDGANYGTDITRYTSAETSKDSLKYINTFLKREAARRNNPNLTIDMTFYGPFQQTSSITGDNLDVQDVQEIVDILQGTSLQNKVPESDYDLVHYVYLAPNTFRSFALPGNHRAFTSANFHGVFGTTGMFIHETLHLFGATDKYNNGDCLTRGLGDPFNPNGSEKNLTDIMCMDFVDLDVLDINTITGREIGWLN